MKEHLLHQYMAAKALITKESNPEGIYPIATEAYYWKLFQYWSGRYSHTDTTDFRDLDEMKRFFNNWLEDELSELD